MGRNGALKAAVAYFVLAACTIHLTSDGRSIATFWPANAVLLAMLLNMPKRRDWIPVLAGGFMAGAAANLLVRGSALGSVYGFCNLLEVALAARLLEPGLRGEQILSTPSVIGRFIAVAGVFAPFASALAGATVARMLFGERFWPAFGTWFFADGLGLLLFTPFFRSVMTGDFIDFFRSRTRAARLEAAALLIFTGGSAYLTFFVATEPVLFVLFAPVMLVTFRVGRLGTKLAVIVVGVIGAVATTKDVGPFALLSLDPMQRSLFFQAYLATLLMTCLPAAAALTAKKRRINSLKEEWSEREAELSLQARQDVLTGAWNRRAFEETTRAVIASSAFPLSLVALDLDEFKQVNDVFGHLVGDRALAHLADLLQSELRETDLLGRVGGDEFLILLPRIAEERAATIAQRLALRVSQSPLRVRRRLVRLSISVGVATFEEGMSYEDFVHAADTALYGCKRARRLIAASA